MPLAFQAVMNPLSRLGIAAQTVPESVTIFSEAEEPSHSSSSYASVGCLVPE